VLRDYENELPWLHRVVRRHLIKLYPLFHALYEGMQLAYQIAYLAGRTQYFSPWLHLLSLKVRRLALHDMVCELPFISAILQCEFIRGNAVGR
jgi:hypothetical protein